VLVFACAQPDPSLRMLDRFLVVSEKQKIPAVVVANKLDLVPPERARELFEVYRRIGYDLIYTSTLTGEGIPELKSRLQGKLNSLAGPSGVGKTSLLNSVQPGLALQVGSVSRGLQGKGMHTTQVKQLFPLDGGGYLADIPGLRTLALWDVQGEELDAYFREIAPLVPHVDVYLFKPGYEGRDFCTLVTGGMSDIPMNAPPDIGHEFRRAELVFYCDEPKSEYVQLLRRYAHLAHDLQSWFWEAHTIPNGDPPTPLFADTPALDCVLLLNSIVRPDNDLRSHLILDGDPVSLLWFIPITSAECEFKLAQGVEALLDVFGQVQHPHVFTGNRRGYV